MAFAILRAEKASINSMTHRSIHNSRKRGALPTDKTDNPKCKIVTYSGTPLKEVYRNKIEYKNFFDSQMKKFGITRKRRDCVGGIELIMTYSKTDNINDTNLKNWVKKCLEFTIEKFGSHNLYECRLHDDKMETSNHIHILLTPFYYDKEKDKYTLNGAKMLGGPKDLIRLQDEFAEWMKDFGLERGISKKITKEKHKSSQKWWSEGAKNKRELEAYRDIFGTPDNWSIEKAAEFKMKAKPEFNDYVEKPNIERIQISR